VVEGNGGTTALTFTVTRAGGFATEASVAYTLDFGTSASPTTSRRHRHQRRRHLRRGRVHQDHHVQVNGDTLGEDNEGFLVRLGASPATPTVVDDSASASSSTTIRSPAPSWRSRAKAMPRPSSASR
jgi:hypothetical protein